MNRLQPLLRRLGEGSQVTANGRTSYCIHDVSTKAEPLTGKDYAPNLIGKPSIVTETAKTEGLGIDDSLTVNGKAYLVRDIIQDGDGALTRYFLRLPA